MTAARPSASSYRRSHRGPEKARDYDRDFWTPGSAKALEWRLERAILARVLTARDHRPGPSSTTGVAGNTEGVDAAPRTALDFACGTGRVLAELERYAPHTIGVDISPDMLALARNRCPRSQLVECDVTTATWPAGEPPRDVDVVTSFRFFLNAEPELRLAALRWIRSVLGPSGRLVANFHLNPTSARGGYLRLRWRGQRRTPMLSLAEAERLLTEAGFQVTDRYGYSYLPYRRDGARLRGVQWRTRVEDWLLERPVPARWAGSFVLVARLADAPRDAVAAGESAGELQAGSLAVTSSGAPANGNAATP